MNDRLRKVLAALAALAALALLAGPAWAGSEDRLGTGGNSAGRILVGAKSVGLAFSNLASTQGVEAMFGNPAGLALGDVGTEVMFSHANYIADMDLNYIAIAQKVGARSTCPTGSRTAAAGIPAEGAGRQTNGSRINASV